MIVPFLEPMWSSLKVIKGALGGRPEISKLALFLSFSYLLYFEKDPVSRVVKKINSDKALLEILLFIDCSVNRTTLSRFVESLYDGPLSSLFDATVFLGLKDGLITLNEHVIDSGKVISNINSLRFLSYPTQTHFLIKELYSQIDFSIFIPLDIKKQGKRYKLITRIKLLLLPYIAGLGSFGMIYKFLDTYPYLQEMLGLPKSIPTLNCMRTWISQKFWNSQIEIAFNTLWYQIKELIPKQFIDTNYDMIRSLDDLYGVFGSKYSKVDRGARVGYKPSDKSNWVGYKDHVSIDKETGLPVHVSITGANVHDTREYIPHLEHLKETFSDLLDIEKSYADKGYDSEENRKSCESILGAKPCISRRNPTEQEKNDQKGWSSHRQRVEQTIGKVREFVRKNEPRYRGPVKVDVWVRTGYFILLMFGLSCLRGGEPELVLSLSLFHK